MKTVSELSTFFIFFISINVHAQVITDGSMGVKTSLNGIMTIPQNLGTTQGNNLFHSFKTFDINQGETVTFTGADNLKNVISRVTGGELSHINGILKLDIKNANFYFINPAGIFFGEGAKVDVPAAFHISTSDSLNFKDGHTFLASLNSNASSLSISDPESFGFLGQSSNNNGLIEINGSQLNSSYINHKIGQTVDLVAGNIIIHNDAEIIAPSGELRLVAVQGKASVSLLKDSNNRLILPSIKPSTVNAGNITLDNQKKNKSNDGNLDTKGEGGGYIALWGGNILFKNANVYADNIGNINATLAKGINIHGYSLDLNDSIISFDIYSGTGNSENAKVNVEITDYLNIKSGSVIKANTYDDGNAARLEVKANILHINSEGENVTGIYSQANATDNPNSKGNAANVIVNAKTIDMLNNGGDGGIFSTTSTKGHGGNVTVQADNISIDGNKENSKTGIFSDANSDSKGGNAGNVTVNANHLNVLNGGSISASTYNMGSAGNINIQANTINIEGFNNKGQDVNNGILAGAIYKRDNYGYLGQVGNITITANQTIHLYNSGAISILNEKSYPLDETNKVEKISIKAADIKLDSGSMINAQARDIANAGQINLNFTQSLTVNNADITTQALKGNGGDINIFGGKVIYLNNQAQINTYTKSDMKGGNIYGDADILLMNHANIKTYANNANNGGDIKLTLKAIIPSQNQLQANGIPLANSASGFADNIIKTANSGILTLNVPQLNVSNSIIGFSNNISIENANLNKGNCSDTNFTHSYLSKLGKGNVPLNEMQAVFIPPATINKMNQLQLRITPSLFMSRFINDNYPCHSFSS